MFSPVLRLALLLGVAVHLIGFFVFRVASSSLPEREVASPFVQYVSMSDLASDLELEEQAALFDSAPLFIPTRWNASQVDRPRVGGFVQNQFPAFEPEIHLLSALGPSNFAQEQDFYI